MNSERKTNRSIRSWALGVSLFLHGFVLLGLGVGTLPGSAPEPGELAVFLAMPSVETQQVPVTQAFVVKPAVTEPMTRQSIQTMYPDPVKVVPAPLVERTTLDVIPEPQVEPSEIQTVQTAEQPAEEISTADVFIPEFRPALQLDSGAVRLTDAFTTLASGVEEISPDHRSPITDHQSTLLAFAGNPAALGMIVQDVLGPELFKAKVLSLPEPVYPILSRKRGEEGRVVLEVTISAEGGVRRAEIFQSSSFRRLDRAALEAVKIAAFNPATEFGIPVESELKVAYRFELENQ